MLERQTRKAQAAFDTIPDAALLVDKAGIILAANRAASYLLAGRAGLSADEDRLRIRDRHLHSKLSRILQGIALAHEFNLPAPAGGAIGVTRPSGAPDWLLQIFPVEKKMPGAALVLIVSAGTDSPSESDLAKLFNLSTMQAQISLRLFEGQPANEIGDGLGISRNTLKTHVRRLFEKLGVTRQTELMRLLSKLKSRS